MAAPFLLPLALGAGGALLGSLGRPNEGSRLSEELARKRAMGQDSAVGQLREQMGRDIQRRALAAPTVNAGGALLNAENMARQQGLGLGAAAAAERAQAEQALRASSGQNQAQTNRLLSGLLGGLGDATAFLSTTGESGGSPGIDNPSPLPATQGPSASDIIGTSPADPAQLQQDQTIAGVQEMLAPRRPTGGGALPSTQLEMPTLGGSLGGQLPAAPGVPSTEATEGNLQLTPPGATPRAGMPEAQRRSENILEGAQRSLGQIPGLGSALGGAGLPQLGGGAPDLGQFAQMLSPLLQLFGGL